MYIVQIAILPARSLAHNHVHTWCILHSNPMNLHRTKSTIEFSYRFYQSVIYIILQYMHPRIAVETVTPDWSERAHLRLKGFP